MIMQERRSLFYTLEEIDTMKDVKKLEQTNRDIIIDTLYLRVNYSGKLNVCSLYLCDKNGTLKTSFPGCDTTNSNSLIYLSQTSISYSNYKGDYRSIYSNKQWVDTGNVYWYSYQTFPEETYGKLYMPFRILYLKYNANATLNNLSNVDIYYKEA